MGRRMPGERRVQIVKQPVPRHMHLDAFGLFGRAAIDPDRARSTRRLHHRLQRKGRAGAARPQRVVPAAVAVGKAVRRHLLHRLGHVAQIRQGVIFRQKPHDRPARSLRPFADKGRRKARSARRGGLEPSRSQRVQMHFGGFHFRHRQLCQRPDLAADAQDRVLMLGYRRLGRSDRSRKRSLGRRRGPGQHGPWQSQTRPRRQPRRSAQQPPTRNPRLAQLHDFAPSEKPMAPAFRRGHDSTSRGRVRACTHRWFNSARGPPSCPWKSTASSRAAFPDLLDLALFIAAIRAEGVAPQTCFLQGFNALAPEGGSSLSFPR